MGKLGTKDNPYRSFIGNNVNRGIFTEWFNIPDGKYYVSSGHNEIIYKIGKCIIYKITNSRFLKGIIHYGYINEKNYLIITTKKTVRSYINLNKTKLGRKVLSYEKFF